MTPETLIENEPGETIAESTRIQIAGLIEAAQAEAAQASMYIHFDTSQSWRTSSQARLEKPSATFGAKGAGAELIGVTVDTLIDNEPGTEDNLFASDLQDSEEEDNAQPNEKTIDPWSFLRIFWRRRPLPATQRQNLHNQI